MPRWESRFEILPAIDVRGGRVVRLEQGSFDRERVYGDDPSAVARAFRAAGARWLHLVDLDGARTGERGIDRVLEGVLATSTDGAGPPTQVQVAGGLRDAGTVASVLGRGASRVVVGTAALDDPTFVGELVDRYGADRIAVAVDVRDGLAVGHGWVPGSPGTPVLDALGRLGSVGVSTFIVTAIDRDGLLGGPDLDLLRRVVSATTAAVIASGGIAGPADLVAVRDLGCRGAIVGRALYDGTIDLGAALAAVSS